MMPPLAQQPSSISITVVLSVDTANNNAFNCIRRHPLYYQPIISTIIGTFIHLVLWIATHIMYWSTGNKLSQTGV